MSVTAIPSAPLGRALLAGCGLAFVAGFVDVVGFVALFGLFTAHVTGNFVLIGAEIVHSGVGVVAKLFALPVFIVAVIAVRFIVLAYDRREASPLRCLLLLQAVLLLGFMAAGLYIQPVVNPDALPAVLTGLTGVAAMAVQNGTGRLVLGNHAPTTIMTGNTTQAVIDAVDILRLPAGAEARKAAADRFRRMAPALAAFATGAILGALGYLAGSFWCLAAPAAILLVLAGVFGRARPMA